MTQFRFRGPDDREVSAEEWLQIWAGRFPLEKYEGYDELMSRYESFSASDIEQIGRWKDSAKTEEKWKPNVASVAYQIWRQAASELPVCPKEDGVADLLSDWSERKYTDSYGSKTVEKRFGLSRATTLLHFISGGRFPIFDARVRRAMSQLVGSNVPNTVRWYLDSYCPLFSEIASLCGTRDLRKVDKALFSYGGRGFVIVD
jgi:hypothetical protein